jgi:hypothetical protein
MGKRSLKEPRALVVAMLPVAPVEVVEVPVSYSRIYNTDDERF